MFINQKSGSSLQISSAEGDSVRNSFLRAQGRNTERNQNPERQAILHWAAPDSAVRIQAGQGRVTRGTEIIQRKMWEIH